MTNTLTPNQMLLQQHYEDGKWLPLTAYLRKLLNKELESCHPWGVKLGSFSVEDFEKVFEWDLKHSVRVSEAVYAEDFVYEFEVDKPEDIDAYASGKRRVPEEKDGEWDDFLSENIIRSNEPELIPTYQVSNLRLKDVPKRKTYRVRFDVSLPVDVCMNDWVDTFVALPAEVRAHLESPADYQELN